MRQEITLGGADALTLNLVRRNQVLETTSAAVKILDANNTTLETGTGTKTADGYSYTPGAPVVSELQADLRIEWEVAAPGGLRRYTSVFDVVKYRLEPVLQETELYDECPALSGLQYFHNGTLEAVDTGAYTATDTSLTGQRIDLQGAVIEVGGDAYRVRALNPETGALQLETDKELTFLAGDTYTLRRSFGGDIDRAWEDLCDAIRKKGWRPGLIVSAEDLRAVHRDLTLGKICRNLTMGPQDVWETRGKEYSNRAAKGLMDLDFQYIDPETGSISRVDAGVRFKR